MPSSASDYPNLFRGSGYYQPGQVVSNGSNLFRAVQAPGRTKSGAVKVSFKPIQSQKAAPAPAPAAAPKPKPKPKPKVEKKPKLKPTKEDNFSKAAAALLKSAEASLAAINNPAKQAETEAEKMKILQTGSVDVAAAPLQIGPAAPPPKTSGVDSFKRRKPASNPMKILTQNSLNI
jgi:pyruvate/2-oxoglutarate dehydrogenase complex dihydrolipoamide acyltransferase (E2) component